MPNYGDAQYWDERYSRTDDDPFDWLFDFDELQEILECLLPDKNTKILLVGAGNAPFSPDMHEKGGYQDLTNIDISPVAIEQQAAKYPNQQWKVMDATQMTFESESFPAVVDKSLIDTLLCCKDSSSKVAAMLSEIHRVVKPGGRYITFSLHSVEEVRERFDPALWRVRTYRVKSNRWDEREHRKRAVAHTMVVCDKKADDLLPGESDDVDELLSSVPAILSEDAYASLKSRADEVNLHAALRLASTRQLQFLLLRATYEAHQQHADTFDKGDFAGEGHGVEDVDMPYIKGIRLYTDYEEDLLHGAGHDRRIRGFLKNLLPGLRKKLKDCHKADEQQGGGGFEGPESQRQ
eukprot:gene24351-29435_t